MDAQEREVSLLTAKSMCLYPGGNKLLPGKNGKKFTFATNRIENELLLRLQISRTFSLSSVKFLNTLPDIFKNEDFFSFLTLHPHVNGVFGPQKTQVFKNCTQRGVFENAGLSFLSGRTKTTRIRYECTRTFSKTEKKIAVFKDVPTRVDKALNSALPCEN